MNKNYKIDKVINDRFVVWYMDFKQKKKNKIGVYRIIDLYSSNKETRFAFRYKHRENQTQEQSDNSILMNCINNFYKTNPYLRSK